MVDDDCVEVREVADPVDGAPGELGVVDEQHAQLRALHEGPLEIGCVLDGWKHAPRETAGTDMNSTS